jgi:hypothetical protein
MFELELFGTSGCPVAKNEGPVSIDLRGIHLGLPNLENIYFFASGILKCDRYLINVDTTWFK